MPQTPELQTGEPLEGLMQTFPHVPQFFMSESSLVHLLVEVQRVSLAGQVFPGGLGEVS